VSFDNENERAKLKFEFWNEFNKAWKTTELELSALRETDERDGSCMLSEADFFCLASKHLIKMDWAVLVRNVLDFPSFGPVVHKMKGEKTYSKNCLKKVCFLSFIANHNPMCHGLEIDMCFFLPKAWCSLCSFRIWKILCTIKLFCANVLELWIIMCKQILMSN
jgi:hypothetical protein